jgi:hypothetical protein
MTNRYVHNPYDYYYKKMRWQMVPSSNSTIPPHHTSGVGDAADSEPTACIYRIIKSEK